MFCSISVALGRHCLISPHRRRLRRHGRCLYDRMYRYAQFPAHPFSVAAAICRHGRCVYESSQRKARFPADTLRLWRRRRRRYGADAGRLLLAGFFVYAAYVAAGCRRYGVGRCFWPGFSVYAAYVAAGCRRYGPAVPRAFAAAACKGAIAFPVCCRTRCPSCPLRRAWSIAAFRFRG